MSVGPKTTDKLLSVILFSFENVATLKSYYWYVKVEIVKDTD